MATGCSSFKDCITDPLASVSSTAASTYGSLSNITNFSVNLVMYILYAVLIVWIGYQLTRTIYVLWFSESTDASEKLRQGITNAVLAAFGIALIVSARFFLVQILQLLGVSEADNVFLNIPTLP